MTNKLLIAGATLMAALCTAGHSHAFRGGGNLGFMPFGFYQPYGVRYSTSVRTPPYFALNPPVYYGQRYYRPYGASPFASPPLVGGSANYHVRAATAAVPPPQRDPGPVACNPFVRQAGEEDSEVPMEDDMVRRTAGESSETDSPLVAATQPASQLGPRQVGPVRTNPFVPADELALESARPAQRR